MLALSCVCFFFFSSRRRHTRLQGDWSSDVCSSDLAPTYISFEDVPADMIEEARKTILEDPALARVPAEKREDFINGKLKKQFGEQVLMMQPWVKDDAIAVGDLVRRVIAETGENIVLRRFSRFELGK